MDRSIIRAALMSRFGAPQFSSEEEVDAFLDGCERPALRSPIITPTIWSGSLSDARAIELYPRLADTIGMYRELTREHRQPDAASVCHWVRKGFGFKTHAPTIGPCYQKFGYLQDWRFSDEPSAEDRLVFMAPELLNGSTSKAMTRQLELLATTRQRLGAPDHHFILGEVGDVTVGILGHHREMCRRLPMRQFWARTATVRADGRRLHLGRFGESGLRCRVWSDDGDAFEYVGVFASGVEILVPSEPRPWD